MSGDHDEEEDEDEVHHESWFHRHHHHHEHHHHQHTRRVIIMATLDPGQSQALKGVAQYPDPASADPANPDFLTDPNATVFWQEDSGGTVIALTEGPTVAGVGTATGTYVAEGTANVQGFASDPDGKTTPLSLAIVFTCNPAPTPTPTPPPSTDATQVVITEEGPPTP